MQILFVWDAHGHADETTAVQIAKDQTAITDEGLRSQAVEYARGVWDQREMLDQRVERHTPQWPPRRQPAVDRNLIRLAVWELTNKGGEPEIVIDDTMEIAKAYSTGNSAAFIHAVLDAIMKEHKALVAGLTPETHAPIAPPDAMTAHAEPVEMPPDSIP
jgi:N utilization substance protein B